MTTASSKSKDGHKDEFEDEFEGGGGAAVRFAAVRFAAVRFAAARLHQISPSAAHCS